MKKNVINGLKQLVGLIVFSILLHAHVCLKQLPDKI